MSRVAVLYGGNSSERAVSLASGRGVLEALLRQGVDAFALDPEHDPIQTLQSVPFDAAFVVLHGGDGEDGHIQAALDLMKIAYTGSGAAACALAMDKQRSKALFAAAGVPVADSQIMTSPDQATDVLAALGPKVMIKPNAEGSSVGNFICDTADDIADAFNQARAYGDVMAEHFIEGPEYTCALVRGVALPVIRIQAQSGVYDYAAKYETGDTAYHIPSGLSDDDESMLQSMAIRASNALGCSGWSRVDFMRGPDGFVALEVNTVPGMTPTSLVPKAAAAVGLSYDALCMQILDDATGGARGNAP